MTNNNNEALKDRLDNRDVSEQEQEEINAWMKDFHEALTCECFGSTKSCKYKYAKIDGKYYLRDTTQYDVNEHCHDCRIVNEEGNTHHGCCDMEMCAACGGQFMLDARHGEIELLMELPKGVQLERGTNEKDD